MPARIKKPKKKKVPLYKDKDAVVTAEQLDQLDQMEHVAKSMFDQADRKAGIKRKPRVKT